MIVLGVETSGPIGSFALRRDGRCVEERFLPELGRRHARSLVPEIVTFLSRHELRLKAVEAIAVSVGPGSFTGLRVGVTFAKTLAYTLDAKLAAVETFAAIAEQSISASSVAVVADAQRRGVMLGRYRRTAGGCFERRGEIELVSLGRLTDALGDVALVSGPGIASVGALHFVGFDLAAPHLALPRASTVARLGEAQLHRGQIADAWTLEPLYVRKSGAEETRDEKTSKPSDA
ncbi:MAG: tRNA (adenosine(37)-N6)-threonylcarbamoyltransferase complex dimerization subunit type 1 TsaB [Planctomycetota bacterium]|nr:tRNA (adenosine(37)-N6)-threonylcarbamoyltransferase complex dimerization subunit type 1 TsaB [Planctomycetaceae bacterium]MDQ3330442.1 tRNA (adenosine(37)-N6)-threonylcarbamoyltransferase complex dimerization subunit type 1 TsaB [Planctomycetota bacterium]